MIETIEDLRNFIRDLFREENIKAEVILYGSRARDTHTPFSDIDIALVSEEDLSSHISMLKEVIEESNLPQKVDIVELSKIPPSLREDILKEGKVWIDLKS